MLRQGAPLLPSLLLRAAPAALPLLEALGPLYHAAHSSHSRCSLGSCNTAGCRSADGADQAGQQQHQHQQQPAMSKPLAPPGLSRTFYKRQLPSPPSIEFASAQGERARRRAAPTGAAHGRAGLRLRRASQSGGRGGPAPPPHAALRRPSA